MDNEDKKKLEKLFQEDNKLKAKTMLTIISRPKLEVADDDSGMELNDGYEFSVNGAIPEIADGIAKLAVELPKNGFGDGSDAAFINLINQYFLKLKDEEK